MTNKLFVLLILFSSISGFSQSNLIGKKAPEIKIEKWIYPKIKVANWQVREVPSDLSGKVVVLDFWATKCAPCVASIPKLNELAKRFPEIVFISISFEKEELINRFLKKMVMYYPVGSDPTEATIKKFGVTGYPETFLIDKNGIIQWQGSPFKLSEKILKKAIGNSETQNSLSINDSEYPHKNSAYDFTLKKNELGMNEASYFHYSPFDINVFNLDLPTIISAFYGYSKSRLLFKDTLLLNNTYDITLKANREVTTEANCMEIFKYLLPNNLEFEMKNIEKDTFVYVLQVYNDIILNKNLTKFDYSGSSKDNLKWRLTGATLKNLKNFLENEYNAIIELKLQLDSKFDFILPSNDFEATVECLRKEYGIELKPQKLKTKFIEIRRKSI
ncbi:MAG: hypothetical protein PWR03_1524 [Tenuifilum sp.]|jgi:thiol-disulfide isomerase/thioredoxin|uniref:TlpA family protein disulfide reductase n=1 Tax=Tenuifilum sp. TaxID=2760880 RepID=UPI0024AAEEB9|nr:TlpA disulfide reductase family protein [Tenuifilum sp.]MDI3527341.1 hypothetical protein [Tenuifilum sp.]